MRIFVLSNSFVYTHDMPQIRTGLASAESVGHTRGGARLFELLAPKTKLG